MMCVNMFCFILNIPPHPKTQLFSLILPKVNLEKFASTHPDDENTWMSPGDTRVRIEQGLVRSV